MKYFVKQDEPEEFADWKRINPTATYRDLGNDMLFPGAGKAKEALRNALAGEQRYLCCYCETRIDSGDFHIEHFKPKDPKMFPELQLSYDNLHASCHKSPVGSSDECCGHKKSNSFSHNLISPLDSDCESHFQYDLSGRILSSDLKGNETIRILNLNSLLLIRSRKALIEEFEDMDDDEYLHEVTLHLDPAAWPLGEYYTTIKYLHNRRQLH